MMMRVRLFFPFLLAVGGGLAAGVPVAANAISAKSPDQVAREFYGWYVGLLVHDKEATEDPVGYVRFVSAPLRAQIKRQENSPDGMDADYFIKAQDYLPDWPGHVAATPAMVNGTTARTTVTLGTDRRHSWRLAVVLVKEAGDWRVSRVQRVR